MPRKNTYAAEHAERIANGEAARTAPELEELDQHDVQEKILNPERVEVELANGEKISFRKAIGPSDVKKYRVMDRLKMLTQLLVMETVKLSGDTDATNGAWFQRNMSYMQMAAGALNIKSITAEAVNAFAQTGHAVDEFNEDSLKSATFILFRFFLDEQAEVLKHSKNDKKK